MIQVDRIAVLLLIPAFVGAAVVGWANFRLPPHWSWSACRLTMMLRPAFGLPLYPATKDLPDFKSQSVPGPWHVRRAPAKNLAPPAAIHAAPALAP